MTTKRIRTGSILEALVTSQARVALLELLLLNSESRFYLREISTLTGQPVRAVQRELARLSGAGLLVQTVEGNRKYYKANRQASVFPELRALLLKTSGLGDVLRRAIEKSRSSISLAFLFGSFARGTDDASSDVDLMVIGEVSGRELANMLSSSKQALGRELNVVLMPPAEFREKVAAGSSFISDVLQGPKIFLIGGEDELREVSGGRSFEATSDSQG
ncbi:MAG: hypothetical protein A2Y93_07715 [Chloroflexi bacterium RBG_13_68_17]|jgi:predicted nucleotidyltransferase|nr:MAG: hypothetical protein A2Y93_07715 [Chloroflexi bacterium RBG_13_68_17]